ncbi:MAG: FMN-binding glutamate synthase family protein [Leptospirales bacterium]|nr:FMN-binding glutamate synthase family protein [Leptospirales bacterium]
MLETYKKSGKERALILPDFKPALERPANVLTLLLCLAIAPLFYFYGIWYAVAAGVAATVVFGLRELFIQDDHAIVRIYGPFGRLRFVFENLFRDKYLQYFSESNTDGRPIPRIVRDYIYQKAHHVKAMSSFGTELDIFDSELSTGCRILHRNFPAQVSRVSYQCVVGEGRSDIKPFLVKNAINVSAMSYGAINNRAAEALSLGALDVAYVNTGEGGYGPHGAAGNDVVFQIGTGKFGVGDEITMPDGSTGRVLNRQVLKELVQKHPNIRMVQLKISQGAKPGIGGHLPAEKVTPEIADVRRVTPFKTVISPPQHTELLAGSPREAVQKLIDFVEEIRTITELPVGIKICVGRLDELDLLALAMKETGKGPDAIQVDGADGGTGAAPNLFVNYVGYGSCIETLQYFHRRLVEHGIRDRVKLSASGRIFTPAHAAHAYASGADICETARGAMLSLGCIQAIKCHTNECPTGITTNSPWRMHGLHIPEKSTRVHHFLKGFHDDMLELTRVIGKSDPRDIELDDIRVLSRAGVFSSFFNDDKSR